MVFLACVLKKKYTNPSSDVITVLAGLDHVDQVISNFVAVLDGIIRNGSSCEFHGIFLSYCWNGPMLTVSSVDLRIKAIKTAIAMTSGAYKTSLVSYFTHRDLFPSLMKVWPQYSSMTLSVPQNV